MLKQCCVPGGVAATGDFSLDLASLCKALAHPARVQIVRHLVEKGGCISGELADVIALAPSTISEHLRILKESGLVQGAIDGPKRCYCINEKSVEFVRNLLNTLVQEVPMETRVHISLEVSDLQKSIEFYEKLFQTTPTKIKGDYANFRLETPQLHLALVANPKRPPEPKSNRHYGIEMFTDEKLTSWLSAAKQAGLQTRIEENTTCCYATANKFWTRDPDGHEWEFWIRLGEADTMHEEHRESVKAKNACCAPGQCS